MVAERVRYRIRQIDAGEIGSPNQLPLIATTMLSAIINHEYQHSKWIGEVRNDAFGFALPANPVSPCLNEPIVERVPCDLRGRLEPPELFHELLEHRYYLSEAAGHEVDNDTALESYLQSVLRFRRLERVMLVDEEGE